MITKNQSHVIVVGSGIIGMCSAFWLQEKGFKVTIIDSDPGNNNASYGNACTMANYGCIPVGTPSVIRLLPKLLTHPLSPLSLQWRYLPTLTPWLAHFLRSCTPGKVTSLAHNLASLLNQMEQGYQAIIEQTQTQSLFDHRGVMYLYGSSKSFELARKDTALRRACGVKVQELNADDIADLEPNLSSMAEKGLMFPDAYQLNAPRQFLDSLLQALLKRGALLKAERISRISIESNHVVAHSATSKITADHLVIATGARSGILVSTLGEKVLLETERGYHIEFPNQQHLISRPVGLADSGFYMVPLTQGLRVAGTVELANVNAPANPARIAMLERQARRLLPMLTERGQDWMGCRPSMPDSCPIIDTSRKSDRIVYAFGHGHLGLSLGGITGKLVAELVSKSPTSVDLAPFRANRF